MIEIKRVRERVCEKECVRVRVCVRESVRERECVRERAIWLVDIQSITS